MGGLRCKGWGLASLEFGPQGIDIPAGEWGMALDVGFTLQSRYLFSVRFLSARAGLIVTFLVLVIDNSTIRHIPSSPDLRVCESVISPTPHADILTNGIIFITNMRG